MQNLIIWVKNKAHSDSCHEVCVFAMCMSCHVSQYKYHIQTQILVLQTEWKFQHNYGFLPASDSVSASVERLPPQAFPARGPSLLGVPPCDLIFPEKSSRKLSSTMAHMMQPPCKLSTITNQSVYRKKYLTLLVTSPALTVVPVPSACSFNQSV